MDAAFELLLDLGPRQTLWVREFLCGWRNKLTEMVESFSVNLGGWFVLEPFITPALFQKYQPQAVDEWTLSTAMAADTSSGGLSQLETHYQTFIVSDLQPVTRP